MKNHGVPFARSYWVVPGKLLAGCYPGDKNPKVAEEKLKGLIDSGVRFIVNLMEEDEFGHDGSPLSRMKKLFREWQKRSEPRSNVSEFPFLILLHRLQN